MKFALIIILLAVEFAGCGPKIPKTASPGYEAYRHPSGLFDCEFPSGWNIAPPPAYPGAPVLAIFLHPAKNLQPQAAPSLWVYYYGEDSDFESPEAYLSIHASARRGYEAGPVEEKTAFGKKTTFFRVRRSLLKSPEMSQEETRIEESRLLVPARKGFFILGMTWPLEEKSPENEYDFLKARFDHLTQTFQSPLL